MNTEEKLSLEAFQKALSTVLKFLPQIYTQRETTNNEGEIVINYPYSSLPNNVILFVLPYRGSLDNEYEKGHYNTLTIRYHNSVYNPATGKYELQEEATLRKSYKILVEDNDGKKRSCRSGDILADRLCMIRFSDQDAGSVILCNSPMYNNIYCSTLSVTNDVSFKRLPTVNGINLATSKEVSDLSKEVSALSSRIITGTEDAEVYFANNPSLPKGTIYLQIEKTEE